MIWFREEINSTQDEMKAMTGKGHLSHLDAIYAGIQTGGRGRHGREWISPAGNLSASIYLQSFKLPLTWVPLWIGLALLRALKSGFPSLANLPSREMMLKWPNDLVLLNGEKLGGILCEKVESGVIAGIGLNIESAPSIEDRSCGSLASLIEMARISGVKIPGDPPKARDVLEMVLAELRQEPSVETLRSAFLEASLYRIGASIGWQDSRTGVFRTGRVLGLGLHGELEVELPDGGVQALFSEEITGIRNS
jgi:biotin-[acetyl-CoA-carboxylase] ligase BirA-like protein